jgi:hypothetical protein
MNSHKGESVAVAASMLLRQASLAPAPLTLPSAAGAPDCLVAGYGNFTALNSISNSFQYLCGPAIILSRPLVSCPYCEGLYRLTEWSPRGPSEGQLWFGQLTMFLA